MPTGFPSAPAVSGAVGRAARTASGRGRDDLACGDPEPGVRRGRRVGVRLPPVLRVLLCDLVHDIIGSGECDLPDGHTSVAGLVIARRLLDETLAGAAWATAP